MRHRGLADSLLDGGGEFVGVGGGEHYGVGHVELGFGHGGQADGRVRAQQVPERGEVSEWVS